MLGSSGLGETACDLGIRIVAWVKRSGTQGTTTCPAKEKPLAGRGFGIARGVPDSASLHPGYAGCFELIMGNRLDHDLKPRCHHS